MTALLNNLQRKFARKPRHIAVIPDGNRRWAQAQGLSKEAGYRYGIEPGLELVDLCLDQGIEELSIYGFTHDNTKRPVEQRLAFSEACVSVARGIIERDVSFLVLGNSNSPMFPDELKEFSAKRRTFGKGTLKTNLLANYDWHWDISTALHTENEKACSYRRSLLEAIASQDVSRIDLVIRWGGNRRLSGLLPLQAVYADFYVVDEYWPSFCPEHFFEALAWYQKQDVTLGG